MGRTTDRRAVAASQDLGAAGTVYRTAVAEELRSGVFGVVGGGGGLLLNFAIFWALARPLHDQARPPTKVDRR